jgi:hypothetical protein
MRQRITAAREGQLEGLLTERDREIVATLDRLRVASTAQLMRLHITGAPSENARIRQTTRALERLVRLRVLARLDRRIGGVRAGSAGFVYALDVAGQRLASAAGPAGGRRLRRPWTPSPAFLAHALAVTELYVRLREAEQAGRLALTEFTAEPLCWRTFAGIGGGRVILKPDALVRVGVGEWEVSSFVEVDRGTHSAASVERKCRVYRRYFQTGREQYHHGVFPQVIWLVPDARRQATLEAAMASEPADTAALWGVAPYHQALAALTDRGAS